MDWEIHRIASSRHYSSGLREIEAEWSITDVWDANRVLDSIEEAHRRASRRE